MKISSNYSVLPLRNSIINNSRKAQANVSFGQESRLDEYDRNIPDLLILHEKLSDGNHKVLHIFENILDNSPEIDPDEGALGGFKKIIAFDSLEIYGERIVKFNNEVCQGDTNKLVVLLMGFQHKVISKEEINKAVDENKPIDFDTILRQLRENKVTVHWFNKALIV